MLKAVAEAIGPDYLDQVVFVGGCTTEPTRVFRRQFILSHATLADSSNWR